MIHPDGTTKSMNNAFNWQSVSFIPKTRKNNPANSRVRPKTGAERTAYAMSSEEEKAAIRQKLKDELKAELLRVNKNTHIGAYCGTTKGQKAPR